jgi:hypothetical protein
MKDPDFSGREGGGSDQQPTSTIEKVKGKFIELYADDLSLSGLDSFHPRKGEVYWKPIDESQVDAIAEQFPSP